MAFSGMTTSGCGMKLKNRFRPKTTSDSPNRRRATVERMRVIFPGCELMVKRCSAGFGLSGIYIGSSPHPDHLGGEAVEVLLVAVHRVAFHGGANFDRFEDHAKGQQRAVGLRGLKGGDDLKTWIGHMVEDDAGRRLNLAKNRVVLVVAPVGTVHDEAPVPVRTRIKLVKGVGESVRPPPRGEVPRLDPCAKDELAGFLENARALDFVVGRNGFRGAHGTTESARPADARAAGARTASGGFSPPSPAHNSSSRADRTIARSAASTDPRCSNSKACSINSSRNATRRPGKPVAVSALMVFITTISPRRSP